jgi:uncharacterized protein
MHVVVAGGTGFLGGTLVAALRGDGHRVRVLTRRPRQADEVAWNPAAPESPTWRQALDDADAVVNLAGASIAGGRWSETRKRAIRESRIHATTALVRAMSGARRHPAIFISASAVGVYGNRGDEVLTEDSAIGNDFLAEVCRDWERTAMEAATSSRVVRVRMGVVLGRGGGALPPMAIPFHFFVGGPVGSGAQYLSWIHIDDWVAMVRWALATDAVSGAINLTAPAPVTNAEFARALGRALRRPSFMRTPSFAMRLVLGSEMAEALILGGQRVIPKRAETMGYSFTYSTIDSALRAIYSG